VAEGEIQMHRTKEERTEDFIRCIKLEYPDDVGSFYEFEDTVIDFLNSIHDSYEHGEGWRMISHNPHAHHTDGPADEDAYRRGYQQGAWHALQAFKAKVPAWLLEEWAQAIYRWRFELTQSKRHPAPELNYAKQAVVEFDKRRQQPMTATDISTR
jgi:hypothetical protein